MSFLRRLFQLILSPGNGWDDIEKADTPLADATSRGFYPLTAVTSVSVFMAWLWRPTVTLPQLLTEAVVTFVMFFGGYFVGALVLMALLQRYVYDAPGGSGAAVSQWKCHTFALYVMSLLELIALINNCVPITLAITLFLPLCVALVIWKGRAFMQVTPERTAAFMLIAIGGVLVPPYLLQLLLHWLLPVG